MFGRDQWISLQSAAETTLFQKTQSGGILLGREHMMFARHYSILKNEEKGMAKNLAAVQSLAQRYPGRVNLMLVPSARWSTLRISRRGHPRSMRRAFWKRCRTGGGLRAVH